MWSSAVQEEQEEYQLQSLLKGTYIVGNSIDVKVKVFFGTFSGVSYRITNSKTTRWSTKYTVKFEGENWVRGGNPRAPPEAPHPMHKTLFSYYLVNYNSPEHTVPHTLRVYNTLQSPLTTVAVQFHFMKTYKITDLDQLQLKAAHSTTRCGQTSGWQKHTLPSCTYVYGAQVGEVKMGQTVSLLASLTPTCSCEVTYRFINPWECLSVFNISIIKQGLPLDWIENYQYCPLW